MPLDYAPPIVQIVGRPGSGKSEAVRRLAAEYPALRVLQVDEFRRRYGPRAWPHLARVVAASRVPMIVESVITPPEYRQQLGRHHCFVVLVQASAPVRRARLRKRGDPPHLVRLYMAGDMQAVVVPDVTLDTTKLAPADYMGGVSAGVGAFLARHERPFYNPAI